jgi:hypothetical protein
MGGKKIEGTSIGLAMAAAREWSKRGAGGIQQGLTAKAALFRVPPGLPPGLPYCPVLNLIIAVFLLFYQRRTPTNKRCVKARWVPFYS